MLKFIAPVLALALLVPAVGRAEPPPAAPTTRAAANVDAAGRIQVKVTDDEALRDDILAVLDLPFAVADARSAGVDEAEIELALDASRDVGLSAGEVAEVVTEEVAAAGKRGVKKGFGHYVRMQLAAGLRGKKLAAKIRERKAELAEPTPEESDKVKSKIEGAREQHRAYRLTVLERRKALVAAGKKAVFVGQERHQARVARLAVAAEATRGADAVLDARLQAIEAKIAAAAEGPEKDAFEAERRRLLKAAGRLDAAADKLETRENKLETRENKLETRENKLEAKAEARADRREDRLEAKAERRDNKLETKAADRGAAPQ